MSSISKSVYLLTGCINPEGMIYTKLQDSNTRREHYRQALNFYLFNTDHKIVFCCNSGHDIIEEEFADYCNRIEFLMFSGNNYDKSLGKGYGEFEIIKFALNNSVFLKETDYIIKITGRLIISNIELSLKATQKIATWSRINRKEIVFIDWFSLNNSFADSRCIYAPKEFYSNFCDESNNINDSSHYYFEHKLFDYLSSSYFVAIPFSIPLHYIGISGSSLEQYNYSPNRAPSEHIQSYLKNNRAIFSKFDLRPQLVYLFLRAFNYIKRIVQNI